jgi:hypothetical protein
MRNGLHWLHRQHNMQQRLQNSLMVVANSQSLEVFAFSFLF